MDDTQNILSTVPVDPAFAAPVQPDKTDLEKAVAKGPAPKTNVFEEFGLVADDIVKLELFGGSRSWDQVRREAAKRNSLNYNALNQGNRLNTWLSQNADLVPESMSWVLPEGAVRGLKRDPNFSMSADDFAHRISYIDAAGAKQSIPSEFWTGLFGASSLEDFEYRRELVLSQLQNQQEIGKQFQANPWTTFAMLAGASLADPEDALLTALPGYVAAKGLKGSSKAAQVAGGAAAAASGALASDYRDAQLRGEDYSSNRAAIAVAVGALIGAIQGGLVKGTEAREAAKELKRADGQALLQLGFSSEKVQKADWELVNDTPLATVGKTSPIGPKALGMDLTIDTQARANPDAVAIGWANEVLDPVAAKQVGMTAKTPDVIDIEASLVPDLELGHGRFDMTGEPTVPKLSAPEPKVVTPDVPVVSTPEESYAQYTKIIESIARKEAGPIEKGSAAYGDILDELDEIAGIDWSKKTLGADDYDAAVTKLKDYEQELDSRLKPFDEADAEPVVTPVQVRESMADIGASKMPHPMGFAPARTTSVPAPRALLDAKPKMNGKLLKFESPVDKALFILAKGNSKHDAAILEFLDKVYDDLSEADIRAIAQEHFDQHVRKEAGYAGNEAVETYVSRAWDQWAKPKEGPKVDGRRATAVQKAETSVAAAERLKRLVDEPEALARLEAELDAIDEEVMKLSDAVDGTSGETRKKAKQALRAAEDKSEALRELWTDAKTLDKPSAHYRVSKAKRDLEDAIADAEEVKLDKLAKQAGVEADDVAALAESLGVKNIETLFVEGHPALEVLKVKSKLTGLQKAGVGAGVLIASTGAANASSGEDKGGESLAMLAGIGLIAAVAVGGKARFKWGETKRIIKNGSVTVGARAGNYMSRSRDALNEAFRDIMGAAGTDHLGGKSGGDAFREMASRQLRVPFSNSLKESFDEWNKTQGFNLASKFTGSRFREFGQQVIAYRRARGVGQWDPSVVKASEALTKAMDSALKMVSDRMAYYQYKGWPTDASLLADWNNITNDAFHVPRLFNFEEIDALRNVHGNDAIRNLIRGAMKAKNPKGSNISQADYDKWLDRMADGYWHTVQHLSSGIQQSRMARENFAIMAESLKRKGLTPQEIDDVLTTVGLSADEMGVPSRLKGRTLLDENYKDPTTDITFTDLLNNDLTAVADNWLNQATSVIARADMTIHGDDLFLHGGKFDWTSRHMEALLHDAVEADGRGGAMLKQYRQDLQDMIANIQGRPIYSAEQGVLPKMLRTLQNVGSGSLGGLFTLATSADVAGMMSHKNFRAMLRHMPGLRRLIMDAQAAKFSREYAEELKLWAGIGDEALGMPTFASERGWASGAEAVSSNYKTMGYKFYGFLTANAAQRRWATRMVHQRFVDMAYGKSLKDSNWLNHVRNMGIDQADLSEVLRMVRKYATTDANGKLLKLSLSEMMTHEPILAQKFNTSVFRWTKKYGSDAFFSQTFPWSHRLLGQVLGQFNGSTFAAHFNHLHYGIKNFDSEVFQNFLLGYIGGVAGYIGTVYERYGSDPKELKKRLTWQEIAKAGFYRSQFAGIAPKFADFTLTLAGMQPLFSNATSRGLDVGLIPLQTAAQTVKAMGALTGVATGSPIDQSEAKAIQRFMLLQGLYTMPVINYLNQTLPKTDTQ